MPIAGWAGDQQVALFGQACFAPGMAKNTFGTGCFMPMNTGDQLVSSDHQWFRSLARQGLGAQHRLMAYAQERTVFMAGATVQWLRYGLQIIDSAA